MAVQQPVSRVIDLLDPHRNTLFNMSLDDARDAVGSGQPDRIAAIDGQFAIVASEGQTVRMARTLGRPARYFIAKKQAGPALLVADRIDRIAERLRAEGLIDQFHPTYTRMIPAHYLVEIRLVGCPDPNPTYQRFFAPRRDALPADPDVIGRTYIAAVYNEIGKWLVRLPVDAPVGVLFSGGIDSGAVFVLTYHAILSRGMNPGRLKAFTLSIDGGGDDLDQARTFLERLDLSMFHEPIEVLSTDIELANTVRFLEDYKPLDVQAGAMGVALLKGIRRRYPQCRYLIDGDGGDENLKDYPIEENPELTIRSVLNNRMLYHEGWGVESIKHSLTYSGGLSRGYVRSYAPAVSLGFDGFSPYVAMPVIAASEGIPFRALVDWDHEKLYALKGQVVSRGVRAVTGIDMPVFAKRRFQHGAAAPSMFARMFPRDPAPYRRLFQMIHDQPGR